MELTPEERNDLRKRVLMGEALSLEQSRAVIDSLRKNSAAAVLAGDKPKKPKKGALSDEALDQDLAGLGL